MNKWTYMIIGLVLGIILTFCLYTVEFFGKITLSKLKKVWKLLNE
jgi:uncharacterized membrane protein